MLKLETLKKPCCKMFRTFFSTFSKINDRPSRPRLTLPVNFFYVTIHCRALPVCREKQFRRRPNGQNYFFFFLNLRNLCKCFASKKTTKKTSLTNSGSKKNKEPFFSHCPSMCFQSHFSPPHCQYSVVNPRPFICPHLTQPNPVVQIPFPAQIHLQR